MSDLRSSETEEKAPVRANLAFFVIKNPHLVIVPCLILILLGGLSLLTLPKDLLPPANLPAVQILSFYSGMPVEQISQSLTQRFEIYTGRAIGMERQESRSLLGVSTVKNFFNASMDLNTAIAQTTSLVMSVLRKLPPGTQPPLILPFDPMGAVPLTLIAVNGDTTVDKLNDFARYEVENAVQAVPGAMAPTVMGGTERQIVVYLKPDQLRKFNLSPMDIVSSLSSFNTFIPSGDVKMGDFDYQILGNGLVDKVKDMDDFPLRAKNGVDVFLKQIGHAEDSHTIQTNIVRVDGKEQVYVPVYRQPGANSIQVVDEIRESMKALEKRFKDRIHNISLRVVADQSEFIRHAIKSISEEAMIGGGLAALMVFLFLGNPRATGGVLLSLPLSLLCAFLGLKMAGETLNAMTLGGLALSIGVLVDNSIVVLENIIQKMDQGMDSKQAAYIGASEVMMPVLSSTMATLVVFFPVVALSGVVKILFASLAKSVIFAMIGSFLVASTVIPLFCAYFLVPKNVTDHVNWLHRTAEGAINGLTQLYGRTLARALRQRTAVLIVVVVSLSLLSLTATNIGLELFPRADAGSFIMNVRLASGTRIEKTDEVTKLIEKKLREWIPAHDLSMIISNAGLIYGFPAAFTQNSGTQDIFFNVELASEREHTSQYYAKIIRAGMQKDFPNLEIGVQLGGLMTSALNGGLLSPIDVQIEGKDLKISHTLALDLEQKIKGIIGAVDVRVQQRTDTPQVDLNVNRRKSGELGLTTDEVMKNVVSAISGSSTFSPAIWVDPHSGVDYLLGVQVPEALITDRGSLASIPVTGKYQNRVVDLSSIAEFSDSKGPSEINHVNLRSVVDILADAQGRDIGGVSSDIQILISKMEWPEGYTAVIRGEFATMQGAVKSLGGGFLLAVVLVYLILVMQFRSFLWPSVILLAVPMGMVGIILMLSLTKTYFSIQAAIGAIFMIGIAVANGVLLIEFILHHVKNEPDIDTAVVKGAMARLRPILMTSLASMLGLVPMAIGLGHGSEANIPLGRAVIGGQLLSTTLTLFVVPLIFRILYARKNKVPKKTTGAVLVSLVLLFSLLTVAPMKANAETTSLGQVLQLAEKANQGLEAAKLESQAAEKRMDVASSDYYPHLELDAIDSAGFAGSSSVMGIGGVLGSPFRGGAGVQALASATLWDFGRVSSKVKSAKHEADSEHSRAEILRDDLYIEATKIYFDCVRNRSLMDSWGFVLKEATNVDQEVRRFVTTGQRSVVEKYLSKSQVEEAETAQSDFKMRMLQSQKRLAILTGLKSEQVTCAHIDDLKDSEISLFAPASKNPTVAYRENKQLVAAAQVDVAQADYMPKIKAYAAYGTYDHSLLVTNDDYAYGIAVTLPLFDGFKTVREVDVAKTEQLREKKLMEDTNYQIALTNAKFEEQITSQEDRLQHLLKEADNDFAGFHLANSRYSNLRGELVDLREALRNVAKTQADLIETRINLQLAKVQQSIFNGGKLSR